MAAARAVVARAGDQVAIREAIGTLTLTLTLTLTPLP